MNRNFAKLEENNRIIYAPDWVIRVDHHHDEWDEPVYDEDGNPVIDQDTGEQKTEHKTQDWDTERRELHPTADDYANAKDGPWLPLASAQPEKDGAYFVSTEYGDETVLSDGRKFIVCRYDERPIVAPPQVTRYSKLKLIVASKAAGKWEAFKSFIASAGYEDEWNAAQFLSSNYAQFEQAKTAIIAAGIATTEEIETILAASVDEEVEV